MKFVFRNADSNWDCKIIMGISLLICYLCLCTQFVSQACFPSNGIAEQGKRSESCQGRPIAISIKEKNDGREGSIPGSSGPHQGRLLADGMGRPRQRGQICLIVSPRDGAREGSEGYSRPTPFDPEMTGFAKE